MGKFCGYCGKRLDEGFGLCPNCDREKLQEMKARERKEAERKAKKKKAGILSIIILACSLILLGCLAVGLWQINQQEKAGRLDNEESTEALAATEKVPEKGVLQVKPEEVTLPVREPAKEPATGPVVRVTIPEGTEIVTDAFFDGSITAMDYVAMDDRKTRTYYFHIPRINVEGRAFDILNEEIFNEFYGQIKEGVYGYYPSLTPKFLGLSYSYGVKDGVLSLLICRSYHMEAEFFYERDYTVYNVSLETGRRISNEEMLELYGLSQEKYDQQLKAALTRKLDERARKQGHNMDYYDRALEMTLSEEYLNMDIPYIDEKTGNLCVSAIIDTLEFSEKWNVALSGSAIPTEPETVRDQTKRWGKQALTWDRLTAGQVCEIGELLGIKTAGCLPFNEGAPYYHGGAGQWLRHVELGRGGMVVASADVSVDPCRLMGAISMYNADSKEPFQEKKLHYSPARLEGTWKLDENNDSVPEKIIFSADGTAQVVTNGKTVTVPYSQEPINNRLHLGDKTQLFATWDGQLYLFPEGKKDSPWVYNLQEW